uniref:Uncharacterized protein n=1 Tax=Meloidogyne floridensis TaxID=298350 RepID=A0A915NBZ2_9BILA
MLYYKLTFILLHLQLLSISAESSDSNNDCSCPKEQIFDSNVKEGVINSDFKILNEKNDTVQYTFDGVKCQFMDCYWEIQPPKVS